MTQSIGQVIFERESDKVTEHCSKLIGEAMDKGIDIEDLEEMVAAFGALYLGVLVDLSPDKITKRFVQLRLVSFVNGMLDELAEADND